MPITLIPTDFNDSVDVRFANVTSPLISANSFSELVSAYSEMYRSNIPVAPFLWTSWTDFFSSFIVRSLNEGPMSFYFKLIKQDATFKDRLQDQALANLLLSLVRLLYIEGKQEEAFDMPKWDFATAFESKFKPTLPLMEKVFPIPSFPSLKLLFFMRATLLAMASHFKISQHLENTPDHYSHLTDLITGTLTGQTGIWIPSYRAKLNDRIPYSFSFYWMPAPKAPRPDDSEIAPAKRK